MGSDHVNVSAFYIIMCVHEFVFAVCMRTATFVDFMENVTVITKTNAPEATLVNHFGRLNQ